MAKQKREQELEQERHEELREETQQQPEPQQEDAKEQEAPEKMTRWRAVHIAVAEVDGDTTYSDIIERATALLEAAGEEADSDRLWNDVDKAVTVLQNLGLCECEWEVRVHPNVPRLGQPDKV